MTSIRAAQLTKTKRKGWFQLIIQMKKLKLQFQFEPKIKTRKVKTKTETSEKTVKKRKAVKKGPEASKTKPTGDKLLDEDKLQNDFAKDFIKEE